MSPDHADRETSKHGPEHDQGLARDARRHRGEFADGMAPDATGPSPRSDDEAREMAAEAGELEGEPLAPVPGARPSPLSDPDLEPGEVELRQKLLDQIRDASFPATRNDLLRHVGPDARGPLQGRLRALPPDLVFSRPEDVVTAFGGLGDVRRAG